MFFDSSCDWSLLMWKMFSMIFLILIQFFFSFFFLVSFQFFWLINFYESFSVILISVHSRRLSGLNGLKDWLMDWLTGWLTDSWTFHRKIDWMERITDMFSQKKCEIFSSKIAATIGWKEGGTVEESNIILIFLAYLKMINVHVVLQRNQLIIFCKLKLFYFSNLVIVIPSKRRQIDQQSRISREEVYNGQISSSKYNLNIDSMIFSHNNLFLYFHYLSKYHFWWEIINHFFLSATDPIPDLIESFH